MKGRRKKDNILKNIKLEIVITILIALVLLAFLFGGEYDENKKENREEEIKKLIFEDAKSKFPEADKIEIITMYKEDEKNYDIVVKANYYYREGEKFCVRREHIRYAYPRRGFANLPPETIMDKCSVCYGCEINLKEEAILVSYEYLKSNLSDESFPEVIGKDGGEKWVVVWKNGKEWRVEVSKDGKVIEIK